MAEPRQYAFYFTFLALCPRACRAAVQFSLLRNASEWELWLCLGSGHRNVTRFQSRHQQMPTQHLIVRKLTELFFAQNDVKLSDLIQLIYCAFKRMNAGCDASWHARGSSTEGPCDSSRGWGTLSAQMGSAAFCCMSFCSAPMPKGSCLIQGVMECRHKASEGP